MLTKSAQFFSLFSDRDLYAYDTYFNQYLYKNRYRIDIRNIQVYGTGISKASYINWIVDYAAYNGNTTAPLSITTKCSNVDTRLAYRMAGFSDKQYIKLFLEKPTPASTNTSLMLPDESYDVLLYKNQVSDSVLYSSVIVQRVAEGFRVYGYSQTQAYFNILESQPQGLLRTIDVGNISIKVPTQYTDIVVQVPYGYLFTNSTVVADFLLSYGKLLETQGMIFDLLENGKIVNWDQMVQEFLYWVQQGWGINSIICLNPTSTQISIEKPQLVVDNIVSSTIADQFLDQNKQAFDLKNIIVLRENNNFELSSQNEQTFNFAKFNFVSYEDIIILRNQSVFGDLVYQPVTGARQNRLTFIGSITADWNGQLNAQGFILNRDNVQEWSSQRRYTKGEIVRFKNTLWSALTIVQPSESFDFDLWAQSDYDQIQKGLLPNLPNKANQLANSYDISSANLETDNDLLSYGLIGFRPRQYMAALDLDDVSQVNVYRQFLKTKGTIDSVRLLTSVNFAKESADYQVYENWAVLQGTYGAQANRVYVDIQLNAALLTANPFTVELIQNGQTGQADQSINIKNVWSTSTPLTTPYILPVNTNSQPLLPSAGYVNLDDVDIAVFSLENSAALDQYLSGINVGTTVWVAKTNAYDWNIYRCAVLFAKVIDIVDNLDGTSIVTFNAQHNLTAGQIFIIKNFNESVNGVYRVITVPSIYSVSIFYEVVNSPVEATGPGLAFILQSIRVSQASNAGSLPFANDIRPGAEIWVDNFYNGWAVLKKYNTIQYEARIAPPLLGQGFEPNTRFGYSIAQRTDNLAVLVGRPDYNDAAGAVINYAQSTLSSVNLSYVAGQSLNLKNVSQLGSYGFSIAIGKNTYAIAGAPTSDGPNGRTSIGFAGLLEFDFNTQNFVEKQLLLPLELPRFAEYGYSVTMSDDERGVYIGAPGVNTVYAYGRQDIQEQFVSYVADGTTNSFSTGDIQFTNDQQLMVIKNNVVQYLGYDYYVNGTNVIFIGGVQTNNTIVINRATESNLSAEIFPNVVPNSTTGAGIGATFNVTLQQGKYFATINSKGNFYSVSETIIIKGDKFGGISPLNDCTIQVTAVEGTGLISGIAVSGTFVPGAGLPKWFRLDTVLYPLGSIDSIAVTINGQFQRPKFDYELIRYDDSSHITPDSSGGEQYWLEFVNIPALGSEIIVKVGSYFEFSDSITVAGLPLDARFGASVATGSDGRQIIVGAPGMVVNGIEQIGRTYVFDRHVEKFQVGTTVTNVFTPKTPIANWNAPIQVQLNGSFIQNTTFYNNGEWYINGSDIVVTAPLQTGDIVEVQVNQFDLLQTIDTTTLQIKSNFGYSVDFCKNNCSVYVGQPNYSLPAIPQCGLAQRNLNTSRVYGTAISVNQNPTLNIGDTLRVNDYEIEITAATGSLTILQTLAARITTQVPNVVASVSNGYLLLNVQNFAASVPGNRLTVLPGAIGTAFTALGFVTYAFTQNLDNPNPSSGAQFGATVDIDSSTTILNIGAPQANLIRPDTFDQYSTPYPEVVYNSPYVLDPNSTARVPTTFDSESTTFYDVTYRSGVIYTFNLLPSSNGGASNPGKFIFGQQIGYDNAQTNDQFGASISYVNNVLLVGSPGVDFADSAANEGAFVVYNNPNNALAWQVERQQLPVPSVYAINSISMYDRLLGSTNKFFDFINPLQGKILGAAQSNIDFTGPNDPASYNEGTLNQLGNTWAQAQLGKIWWDTTNVRFIDASAGNLAYASVRWGQVFAGSSVDVYQWIASTQTPAEYTGEGVPYSFDRYVSWTTINTEGIIEPLYFFWVSGLTTVARKANKTLSTAIIARYIEDPKTSGISYVAPVRTNAISIVNGNEFVKASDTIIHIEYDKKINDAVVHQEYELLAAEVATSFLSPSLYQKLIDSLCGVSNTGAIVPDPNLSVAMRYGVQYNPRQSMFVNRFAALQNYITQTNNVLLTQPITESRRFTLLNQSDPVPTDTSGQWNFRVDNLEQLGWQNIYLVPLGYKYLVLYDADNDGLWTIYTVTQINSSSVRELLLTKVQSWDVKKYWNYVDWYQVGFNSTLPITAEVPNYAGLEALPLPVGSIVKVTANSQNKWEVYLKTELSWTRVGLQDGTIQFDAIIYNYALGKFGYDGEVFDAQYFDQTPQIETRYIIESINQELFIDELLIERNRLMILMFNYVLTEQESPEWLIKTSLIDVTHRIRELLPYQVYRRDNQDFVLEYINEVKPYHTQIRQFNLQYSGLDDFAGDVTDYDLPAYFDTSLTPSKYISPILVDIPELSYSSIANAPGANADSNASLTLPSSAVWITWPYSQWYNAFLLELGSIEVINSGNGYSFAPTVTISGVAKRLGTAEAVINSAGQVVTITVTDPGEGYYTTPTVLLSDPTTGVKAVAVARMVNDLVRSFKLTLNYDRYQYNVNYVPWEPNVSYDNGDLVLYDDRVWKANSTDSTAVNTPTFDTTNWILVPIDELSGVDRTMAYYVATVNQPGRELPLLISGVDYPGVEIQGVAFDAAPGFDTDPYDSYVFDNIEYGPEGLPTYSDKILDTIYNSRFLDQYLGTRSTDVNVYGGEFVDTYSSHAPEELVPGSEFDTLDFRVYTTPGADWTGNGHGFVMENIRTVYQTGVTTYSFANVVPYPVAVSVTNVTQQTDLTEIINYTVHWPNQTLSFVSGVNDQDILMIRVYELGGGNQLYKGYFIGNNATNTFVVPMQYSLITEFAIFVNGARFTNFTSAILLPNQTLLTFGVIFNANDYVSITALGQSPGLTPRSWSKPMTQTIVVTNASQLTYTLTNSLQGTNIANMIVTKNGFRARPYQTVEYIADGSGLDFYLPERGGYSQSLIADPDVTVYVDNVKQNLLSQYTVSPWDGSSQRQIQFVNPPAIGATILIAVSTRAQYFVSSAPNLITFRTDGSFGLNVGDVIEITTWNDTSQQNAKTLVFVGPITEGVTIVEPYDFTPFSSGDVLGAPGSFDYGAAGTTTINSLNLVRANVNPGRLWVNLNGRRLVFGVGFTLSYVNGTTYLVLPAVLSSTDVVTVTLMTNSVVPGAMAFRIFQDMRGIQATYRITAEATTKLTQPLLPSEDIMYVVDAGNLGEPNVANNVWGVVTVNYERIMYRYRNIIDNTISGLMRGTAGTAIANIHAVNSDVIDMSQGSLLPVQYQDYMEVSTTLSDGTTNVFTAPNINISSPDSSFDIDALRVTVGGIVVPIEDYNLINEMPLTIEIIKRPPAGVEVSIAVMRGVTWYQRGVNTPSDGVPLQETNTEAARFLRGL